MQENLIPASFIKNLVEGSYEYLICRLQDVLEDKASELFGRQVNSKILGTFKGHVLVLSEDGQFLRIKYEEGRDKSITILDAEKISIPVYNPNTIESFVGTEATAIVASLMEGRSEEAKRRLEALIPWINTNND